MKHLTGLRPLRFSVTIILLLALYGLTSAVYWRGVGPGAPLQEPMHYVDQYKYPRAWTRSQLAPGVPDPTPFAAVYGHNAVGQRFRNCCDNLAMLRVWLGGAAGQRVVFSLRTGPDRVATLYSATIRLERDGHHDFTFPPLPDSAGQVYYFFVEAPEARTGEAVALRVIPGDRVGGVPLLNEYTAAGNLDFAAYHQGRPGGWLLGTLAEQVLPRTLTMRLRQYKPGFFKGDTFWWLLAATAVGAFVWLIVAWPGGQRQRTWQRSEVGLAVGTSGVVGILLAVVTGVAIWPHHAAAASPSPFEVATDSGGPSLVHDLLLSLYPAEKKPERRFFSTTWAEVDGQRQPCVVAPPDSTLSYGLRLPPEATLRLGVALEFVGAWRRFEVNTAEGDTLFHRELHGPEKAQATVDLSPYGGQDVRLVLRTVGREGDTSPGLWCAPQIESTRSWLLPYPLPADAGVQSQSATFGDALELLGYRLETPQAAPGDQTRLTLYWHTRQRVTTGYTVFVHLLDEAGEMRGQHDSQPVNGAYPTTLWSPDKVIVDRYDVPVNEDAPPGQYHLAVGLYDLATLQRLPAFDSTGRRLDGDRLLFETLLKVDLP
jgi:hypothetical protein